LPGRRLQSNLPGGGKDVSRDWLDILGSSFKCNTFGPQGIGCCDGQTIKAPQWRGTWRDSGEASARDAPWGDRLVAGAWRPDNRAGNVAWHSGGKPALDRGISTLISLRDFCGQTTQAAIRVTIGIKPVETPQPVGHLRRGIPWCPWRWPGSAGRLFASGSP